MKITYDRETDSLTITLRKVLIRESDEIGPGVVADYVRQYAALGIAEVICIFRNPFDTETMTRLSEVREHLRA